MKLFLNVFAGNGGGSSTGRSQNGSATRKPTRDNNRRVTAPTQNARRDANGRLVIPRIFQTTRRAVRNTNNRTLN